jgi:hypothetical protein
MATFLRNMWRSPITVKVYTIATVAYLAVRAKVTIGFIITGAISPWMLIPAVVFPVILSVYAVVTIIDLVEGTQVIDVLHGFWLIVTLLSFGTFDYTLFFLPFGVFLLTLSMRHPSQHIQPLPGKTPRTPRAPGWWFETQNPPNPDENNPESTQPRA